MTEQDRQATDLARPEPGPAPLEALVAALKRPLTVGTAIVIAIGQLLVIGVLLGRHNESFERIESSVSSIAPVQTDDVDPESCWLIGAAAYAQGRGKELVKQLTNVPMTHCITMVHHGAMGRGM